MSEELFHAVMDVNVTSAFLMCRAVGARHGGAQARRDRQHGVAGRVERRRSGRRRLRDGKGAIVSLTKALAKELAPHGIRVNCVAPGLIGETAFHGRFTAPEAFETAAKGVLLGRAGTPEEVAASWRSSPRPTARS